MRSLPALLLVALVGVAGAAAAAHAEALREISPPVADTHPEQVAPVVGQVLAAVGCRAETDAGARAGCSDQRSEIDAAKSDDPCAYENAEANAKSDWTGAGARIGCGRASAHSRTGAPDTVTFGEETQRQVNATLQDVANATGVVVRPPDGIAASDAVPDAATLAQSAPARAALPVEAPSVPPAAPLPAELPPAPPAPSDAACLWRWVRWFTG